MFSVKNNPLPAPLLKKYDNPSDLLSQVPKILLPDVDFDTVVANPTTCHHSHKHKHHSSTRKHRHSGNVEETTPKPLVAVLRTELQTRNSAQD